MPTKPVLKNDTVLIHNYLSWIVLLLWSCVSLASEPVHHRLSVSLAPAAGSIHVNDTIDLPKRPGSEPWSGFYLRRGLQIEHSSVPLSEHPAPEPHLVYYRFEQPLEQERLVLRYRGRINSAVPEEGVISPQGVFLSKASGWFPVFGQEYFRFSLTVETPAKWLAVSQGKKHPSPAGNPRESIQWQEDLPQDDIYLIAGKYKLYEKKALGVRLQFFSRRSEPELARRYFESLEQYLTLYQQLIGSYPYHKFAVVENFWETGLGMPSFTLLGPRVLRFPFILHSSLPHELLHNWWGNGVYVNYDQGNWAEGLTAYLADHLIQERRGQGANYRRSLLQKYRDYVASERDFPLQDFRVRHDSASEAIGYGKGAMFFHMLKQELGDTLFFLGLRKFYRDRRFSKAGFDDLRQAWETVSGRDLQALFAQWLKRTGAPELRLSGVRQQRNEHAWQLDFELQQVQKEPAYWLTIPVQIQLEQGEIVRNRVTLSSKQQFFSLALPGRALRISIDPDFDVFRRLSHEEIPAALSQGFGAEEVWLVLPRQEDARLIAAYQQLAEQWQRRGQGRWQVVFDDSLEQLPEQGSVWLLGWNNRFRARAVEAWPPALRLHEQGFVLNGQSFERNRHALVAAIRRPNNHTLLWLAAGTPQAIAGLARKLPHYRKYSYLVFEGKAPDNVLKGQWPTRGGPLVFEFASEQ